LSLNNIGGLDKEAELEVKKTDYAVRNIEKRSSSCVLVLK
jgi:hypothetical protein